jgi:hypothetical protein
MVDRTALKEKTVTEKLAEETGDAWLLYKISSVGLLGYHIPRSIMCRE